MLCIALLPLLLLRPLSRQLGCTALRNLVMMLALPMCTSKGEEDVVEVGGCSPASVGKGACTLCELARQWGLWQSISISADVDLGGQLLRFGSLGWVGVFFLRGGKTLREMAL